jgi:hypothetical protein
LIRRICRRSSKSSQASRGQFATDEEVKAKFRRFDP